MDKGQGRVTAALREAHLRDYWKIVWQGRWTIMAVFALTLGATAVWTYLKTPIFRSMAVVEVQPQARRVLADGDVSGLGAAGYGWLAEEKYHNTQVEIIKSRDIARRAVKTLGLETHPDFARFPDPVEMFRRMIRVEPRRDTGLLEISITGSDPAQITQWVNGVAQAYVDRNLDNAKANLNKAMLAIGEQLIALTRDLTSAEDERIQALGDAESQILNAAKQEDIVAEQLKTYNNQLTDVRVRLSSLGNKIERIETMERSDQSLIALPEFGADLTLQNLQQNRIAVEQRLASAQVELGASHPDYEEIVQDLEAVRRRIDDRLRVLAQGIHNDYEHAVAQEHYLQDQVQNAEAFSVKVARATSRYEIRKTDAETKKQLLDVLAMSMKEVYLQHELMNNNITILDEATPPLWPIKPRPRTNLAVGALFGMCLGLGVVFFLDYLDNTIRTPEDVEKYLGLAAIGVVPKYQVDQGEALSQRAVKEAYQSLRTSIIFSSKNRQRKVALITSTGPREGKSSTVANLGRILAAAGDRVAIIDCDLRRPKQHEHHQLQREPGLTNYLAAPAQDRDWMTYARPQKPANLHVMVSGPLPPSPPDLLGGERFREMLDAMREIYDWVLIDSPPAASLADATLLASLADMVVLVVHHNRTDRDHVVKTVQQLSSANANFAGVVLNNVDLDRTYHRDYYYAGYYYEDHQTKERRFRRKGPDREAQVG